MESFDLRKWPGSAHAGLCQSLPAIVDNIIIDTRRIDSKNTLFVALKGSQIDGHHFVKAAEKGGARYALVRHDWIAPNDLNITLLRVTDPLKAFQDIVKYYKNEMSAKIICITGSYGKTMVKDLLELMVSTTTSVVASPESFNSQIGVPLSLLHIQSDHQIALIEAGISQPGEMQILADLITPYATILTHVGKKHQSSLGCLDKAKSEFSLMLKGVNQDGWILYPSILDPCNATTGKQYEWNKDLQELPHAHKQEIDANGHLHYHIRFPDHMQYRGVITDGYKYFLDLINLTIKSAWLIGVPSDKIIDILSKYTPEPMRTEIWKFPDGPTFINDIYCSDPQSIDTSLKYLSQAPTNCKKTFVFSGMRKHKPKLETDYRRIGQSILKTHVDHVILIGSHNYAPLIEEIKTHAPHINIKLFSNYDAAFTHLKMTLSDNDHVLFKGERKLTLDTLTEVFNDSICSNQCFVNLAAIQSNLKNIRAKIGPSTRLMVMVKALAYGTNDIQIAKFLGMNGIDILGVSYVEEGVALKRAGVTQSIFTINAAPYEAAKVAKWGLEVGVSDQIMIEALAKAAAHQQKLIKVHLHVNTGMGRFGCRPEQALELCQMIQKTSHLLLDGIMTHFACAEDPQQDDFTMQQVSIFEMVINQLEQNNIHVPWKHAANSAAATRFEFPQFNMARIGLAVYGLYSSEATKDAIDLQLALSMVSRIVGINHCKAGETISYGRKYTVQKEEQKIAVLPIGYYDGLHRHYSGKSEVIIKGQKASMIGNICMDYMMVDVTHIPHARIGDPVLIFGEDEYGNYLSPEELASQGNSIIHELVTCLGPRIQRIFIHEERHQIR